MQDRLFAGGARGGGGGARATTDADAAGAEPEFLGFLDADTFFSAAVHPGELFEYDATTRAWRPRVIAYNIKTPWGLRTPFALGGQPKVLEAMVRERAKGERARASPPFPPRARSTPPPPLRPLPR